MLGGSLKVKWINNSGDEVSKIIVSGDHVDTSRDMHTFENTTDIPAKFFALKMMPTGENYRETFKTDKVTR